VGRKGGGLDEGVEEQKLFGCGKGGMVDATPSTRATTFGWGNEEESGSLEKLESGT